MEEWRGKSISSGTRFYIYEAKLDLTQITIEGFKERVQCSLLYYDRAEIVVI